MSRQEDEDWRVRYRREKRYKQFCRLKHALSHLLFPLALDLQGLIETDFEPGYWSEVSLVYRDEGSPLAKAMQLLYRSHGGVDTLEEIYHSAWGAASEPVQQAMEQAWQEVTNCLGGEKGADALAGLWSDKPFWGSDADIDTRKKVASFCDWYAELDNALYALGQAIADAPEPEELGEAE